MLLLCLAVGAFFVIQLVCDKKLNQRYKKTTTRNAVLFLFQEKIQERLSRTSTPNYSVKFGITKVEIPCGKDAMKYRIKHSYSLIA